jgi:hypothetical protein
MTKLRMMLTASLLCVATGSIWAQGGGPGPGPGTPGAGPMASAPRMGQGMGMGGGPRGGRMGMEGSPGWALMTEQERNEHRERMRSMKSYDECKAYQQQHHEQMAARARQRGAKPLAAPRRDPCSGMKR